MYGFVLGYFFDSERAGEQLHLSKGAWGIFPIRPGKLDVLFHISAQFLSETCRLNCYYHLPSNDMPTFNGCSTVDLLSVYSIC